MHFVMGLSLVGMYFALYIVENVRYLLLWDVGMVFCVSVSQWLVQITDYSSCSQNRIYDSNRTPVIGSVVRVVSVQQRAVSQEKQSGNDRGPVLE